MKFVIQRVNHATVNIDGEIYSQIGKGLLVFAGFGNEDTEEEVAKNTDKIIHLRIFEDENGKTNLSLNDVGGSLMIVSQFTLYANCKKGNRPSFIEAGKPEYANQLYEFMIRYAEEKNIPVAHGSFGADMKITLENDGPFTILL